MIDPIDEVNSPSRLRPSPLDMWRTMLEQPGLDSPTTDGTETNPQNLMQVLQQLLAAISPLLQLLQQLTGQQPQSSDPASSLAPQLREGPGGPLSTDE